MKTIGLLGGMSWESTLEYYRIINQIVKARLSGSHSAQCLLYSVDFDEIEALQHAGEWDALTELMINAVRRLERGGADCLVICTNTMHRMADAIQAATTLPLLHIADATAAAVKAGGLHTVGLLGTRFTMEGDFFRGKLERMDGLNVLVPNKADRQAVHRVIYGELVQGITRQESRELYLDVIAKLHEQGAQGVILGCTEIPLLVKQENASIPVFDTTAIHAQAAVEWALTP
jgi:aspartate racemase